MLCSRWRTKGLGTRGVAAVASSSAEGLSAAPEAKPHCRPHSNAK